MGKLDLGVRKGSWSITTSSWFNEVKWSIVLLDENKGREDAIRPWNDDVTL
jgi:hypothetical protein